MAASKDEVEKKLTFRLYEEGVHRWRSQGENIFNEDTSYKCPTYVHRTPPCQGSCPSAAGSISCAASNSRPRV